MFFFAVAAGVCVFLLCFFCCDCGAGGLAPTGRSLTHLPVRWGFSCRGGCFFLAVAAGGGGCFFFCCCCGGVFFFLLLLRGGVCFFAVSAGGVFFFLLLLPGGVFFFCCWGPHRHFTHLLVCRASAAEHNNKKAATAKKKHPFLPGYSICTCTQRLQTP